MMRVALQLWSVRQEAEADLAGTLRALAAMGYDGVEFAGFYGHVAEDVKRMLDDAGLVAAGSHTPWHTLIDPQELPRTMQFHKTIGCRFLIIPSMDRAHRDTPDRCRRTGEALTMLTEQLAGAELWPGYHTHDADVRPLEDGRSAWWHLGQATPRRFILQYDTANALSGGADPVQPLLDFPGRGLSTHLKEYAGGHGKAALGEGDVPWGRVFDACEQVAGTQWYVVEQEGHPTLPPMEAARKSLDNLRGMLARRG